MRLNIANIEVFLSTFDDATPWTVHTKCTSVINFYIIFYTLHTCTILVTCLKISSAVTTTVWWFTTATPCFRNSACTFLLRLYQYTCVQFKVWLQCVSLNTISCPSTAHGWLLKLLIHFPEMHNNIKQYKKMQLITTKLQLPVPHL